MRTLCTLVLTGILTIPSLALAQDHRTVLAVTEGIALPQSEMAGMRRSPGRMALGLAMAGAGAAMLLIDPKQPVQPTQPGVVLDSTLVSEAASLLLSPAFTDAVADVDGADYICYPNFLRSCEYTNAAFWNGAMDGGIVGAAIGLATATSGTRTIYGGPLRPFIPFKERSPAMKYGGAALVVAGAAIAGFWSTVPVMRDMTIVPTRAGLQVGTSIGF